MFGPIQYLTLAAFALSSQSLLVYEIQYPRPQGYCGCMYTLEDSEDLHLPSLWITLCDTSPPAASVVAAQIRNEWSPTSLGSSPALAATWRSAARASGYLHILTSLPHRYDDKGALSSIVGYTNSNSTMRATAPPPAPTAERVPEASSRVRTITDPCWA